METILKPGDIFLTRGRDPVSLAVRVFTRQIGEKRTVINHVGLVVEEGNLRTAQVVEAMTTVRCHRLWDQYGPPEKCSFVGRRPGASYELEIWKKHGRPRSKLVAVYRPYKLEQDKIDTIVAYARKQVGRPYGFKMLLAHLADWALLGSYVFRALLKDTPHYPICSWLVARAFSKVGLNFRVPDWLAQPDDIWDFIRENDDKYRVVYPLSRLS